jgi:hypothetical protein
LGILGIALFGVIITGWPFVILIGQSDDFIERIYQAAIAGMLIHGAIAIGLADLGIFHLWIHGALIITLWGACYWQLRRRGIPLSTLIVDAPRPTLIMGAMVVILLGALFLNGTPSEVILGGRDAGIYVNTGIMIARTGGIRQADSIVADLAQRKAHDGDAAQAWSNLLGVQSGARFMSSRLRLAGLFIDDSRSDGAFTPQFLHLFPAWIALFAALFGVNLGILATGFAGVIGVWSVGMAGRAMHRPWVGVIAMALLTLNGVQVWFSRYPMSETTAQWLFFVIIYGVARLATPPITRNHRLVGLLVGVAVGQLMLARLDFVFVVIPLVAWLGWRWVTQRIDTPLRWVLLGLAISGGQGIIHLLTISRGYFVDTFFAGLQSSALGALLIFPLLTPALQHTFLARPCSPLTMQPCPGESIANAPWNYGRIGSELVVVVFIIGLFFYLRRRTDLSTRVVAWLTPWYPRICRVAAVGMVLGTCYAYLIRPQILTPSMMLNATSCLSSAQRNKPSGDCLALQGYIGAPIVAPTYPDIIAQTVSTIGSGLRGHAPKQPVALRDLYANSMANLVRIGWYISPFGIEISLLGLALWLWRGVGRRDWLFMVITLATTFLYVQLSYGTSSQTYIYIMRRYLPTVYPGLALMSGYGIVALWGMAWWRKTLSVGSGIVLVGFLVATIRPMITTPEHQGAFAAIDHLAQQSSANDVTLIRGGSPSFVAARDAADVLALPLMAIHGQAAFGIRSQNPDKYADDLTMLYRRWIQSGRHVYLLLGADGGLWLPGMHFVKGEAVNFQLPEFSQLLNQKPASVGTLNIAYQRYELVDGTAPLPAKIDTTDTASQVSGFYTHETIAGQTFAWTNGHGVLRMPLPTQPTQLMLTVAGGKRPATIGQATVCIDVAGQPDPRHDDPMVWTQLQCMPLSKQPQIITVTIPGTLHSVTDTLLVQLRSEAWVAANVDPNQNDLRPLGVQFVTADMTP